MRSFLFRAALASAATLAFASAASADTSLWSLQTNGGLFTQDWSNIALITTNDDWAGVPSITGFRGDDATAGTAVDPQTIVSSSYSTFPTPGVIDVNANQLNPNTFSTGGATEFDQIADPSVALTGSGTADFPGLVFYMDATNVTNITISYNLRDLDGSTDNSVQQVALQYRVGGTGDFVNVPGAYVADASSGPSLATLVTPVSASDLAWDNAGVLEFRVMTSNAIGNDEWIAVDDIRVSGTVVPEPASLTLLALGGLLMAARRR